MLKQFAIAQVQKAADRGRSRIYQEGVLRECVQMSVLRTLSEKGAFSHIAFMGGTALRFLYRSRRFSDGVDLAATSDRFRRFSEDVDLTLEEGAHDFGTWIEAAGRQLEQAGFEGVKFSVNLKTTVVKAELVLPGLLREAKLASMKEQKLMVKVEMDTNPPVGAGFQQTMITSPDSPIAVRCHDLPTLMAGKIAALVMRPYIKARDWYDLDFYSDYLERGVRPNLALLQDAIRQNSARTKQPEWAAAEWLLHVERRLRGKEFPESLSEGIRGFLEDAVQAESLTRDRLLQVVDRIERATGASGSSIEQTPSLKPSL